jgi:cyclophilin family peptidyl-prolyl cis-trans isomerase
MRSVIALLSGALLLAACGADEPAARAGRRPALPHAAIHDGPHDVAVLRIRDLGDIRIELLPEASPETVANFVKLANAGFYDGTQFHRVLPGFMTQGGDPNTKKKDARTYGKGGPGYTIEDEFSDLSHTRGTLSMANSGTPNSSHSQFFIIHQDATHLDGHHAAFGRVVDGMDVVDAITELELDTYGRYGPSNRPYPVPAVVETIRIEPAGTAAAAPSAADAAETEAAPSEASALGTEGAKTQEEQEKREGPKGPGGPERDPETGEVFGS